MKASSIRICIKIAGTLIFKPKYSKYLYLGISTILTGAIQLSFQIFEEHFVVIHLFSTPFTKPYVVHKNCIM